MPLLGLLPKLGEGQPMTGYTSPEEIERRRLVAEALLMEGMGSKPIVHPMQGVDQLAGALIGGLGVRRANREEREGRASGAKAWQDILAGALGGAGGGGGAYPAPDTGPATTGSVAAPAGAGGYTGGGPTSGPVAGAVAANGLPTVEEMRAYARKSAMARNIDPDVAVRVGGTEGMSPNTWQSNIVTNGNREESYGPYQFNTQMGLGNDFMKATGLDPRDPKTWPQQIDFALDTAKRVGWTPFHGAKNNNIGQWEGITRGESAEAPGTQPVSGGTMAESGPPGGFVLEKQAGIRKQPIAPTTRSYLERAGAATGLRAVVVSGGQDATGPHRTGSHRHDHGGAADIDLVDIETGRVLSQNNREDRARMAAFIEESVAAGATGIGAGPGYMGPTRIHVGGGSEAVWGAGGSSSNAADWAKEAYYRGKTRQRRGGETADLPNVVPVGMGVGPGPSEVARERLAQLLMEAGVSSPAIAAPTPQPRPMTPNERIAGVPPTMDERMAVDPNAPVPPEIAAAAGAAGMDPRMPQPRPDIPADRIADVPLPPEDPAQAAMVAAAANPPPIPQPRPEPPPEALAAALAQAQPPPTPEPPEPPPIQQAAEQPLPPEPATTGSVPGGDDVLARARAVGFGNLDAPETPGALTAALMATGTTYGGPGGGAAGGMPGGVPTMAYVAELMGNPWVDPQLKQLVLKELFPDPGEGFTLGDTRYDAAGNVIVTNPTDKLLTPEEEAQKMRIAGAGATKVSNVVGATGGADEKFWEKLGGAEGERWSKIAAAGPLAADVVADLDVLDEALKLAPQGPVTGRLAEMFPGFSSAGALVTSIVNRMAPRLRVEGSGATSDMEFAAMLASLTQLRNRPEANRAISAAFRARANLNLERAEVVTLTKLGVENGGISKAEGEKRMAALDRKNILSPELKRLIDRLGPDPQQTEFSDEEVENIPEGTTVEDDNGNRFIKHNGELVPVQ